MNRIHNNTAESIWILPYCYYYNIENVHSLGFLETKNHHLYRKV